MSDPGEQVPSSSPARLPADTPVSESVLDTVLGDDTVVESISVESGSSGPPSMRPVAGGRHEARERAVHLLYEAEMKGLPIDGVLAAQVLAPDPYTTTLVRGAVEHREELDDRLRRLVRGWTLERMATLDLVVLRVACYELAHQPEVPRGVVLSEAVELAARYGTDDSPRFVNGVLGAAADQLRPAEGVEGANPD